MGSQSRSSPVRKAALYGDRVVKASLVHYAAGLKQEAHVHETAQVSVLLAGSLREVVEAREAVTLKRSSGVKPAGIRHAAEFGPDGALMLSIEMPDTLTLGARPPCEWRAMPEGAGLISAILTRPKCSDALWDLIAMLRSGDDRVPIGPSPEARLLKQALDDDPAPVRIEREARRLGVHRVHLSRSFTAAYGLAPSLYRMRVMTARALSSGLRYDASLAAVAAESGFADQSHLARTFRREIGAPLSHIRSLLGQVTSVQGDPDLAP